MRFRDEELTFKVSERDNDNVLLGAETTADKKDSMRIWTYPAMTKTLGSFKLTVNGGMFKPSEIIMMLGENGTGKTTLIKIIAGLIKPD
jgi:ATP-binding cassette, sub-family E, member 1